MLDPALYGHVVEIVNASVVASGARLALLTLFNHEEAKMSTVYWTGPSESSIQQALAAARRLVPHFDPAKVELGSGSNWLRRAVYVEGQPVAAPLRDLAQDIVDDRILTLAGTMLGLNHSLLVPIRVEGDVAGSLGLHGPTEMTSTQWIIGESFARQIGLTIENARLHTLLDEAKKAGAGGRLGRRAPTDEPFRDALRVNLLAIASRDRTERGLGSPHDGEDGDPLRVDDLFGLEQSRAEGTPAETVMRFADIVLDVDRLEAARAGERLGLTRREYDLLLCFMRHPRQVLSRDHLCRDVWGYDFDGESNFVDVAVKELRKKMEANGQPRLIHTVRGYGYVLRDE